MKNRVIVLLLAVSFVCASASVQGAIWWEECELEMVENGLSGDQVAAALAAAAEESAWTYQELSGWYEAGNVEVVRDGSDCLVSVDDGGGIMVIISIEDLF